MGRKRPVGRPRILRNSKITTIYLEKEEFDILRRLAYEKGKSFTSLVREILRDYLIREGFLKEG